MKFFVILRCKTNTIIVFAMKKSLILLHFLFVVALFLSPSVQAQELVWKAGEALITDASQITGTPPEDSRFTVANLIRPESDGVGTNQYIYHTAWSGENMITADVDPFLQFHLNEAKQHIIFSMIGSAWQATYDTPTEVVIQAANLPGEWTTVTTLTNMQNEFTSFRPERYTSPHIDLGGAYTDVKFLVKKTYANRRQSAGGLLLSLGRFQIYEAYEGEPDPIDPTANINLLFIGNSITYGATLSDPSTQAPPVVCRDLIQAATEVSVNVYNGGHSGITTFGYMPGRDDFTRILASANVFKKNGGKIYISIMLGTNDSACTTTEGAPVAPATYDENMRTIINKLLEEIPECKIIVNYPIWYSPSTYNGAKYLQEGLDRLHSYYPVLDGICAQYDQVYAGNRGVWEYFENNFALFTRENGNAGYFYLHPNQTGAQRLAEIWARELLELIEADSIEVKNPLPEWNTFKPSNNKKYSMKTARGSMGVKEGKMTSTVRTDIGATKGEFAFISYEGQLYLYSVADHSFMYRDPVSYQDDWSNIVCSNDYLQPIKVNYIGTPSSYPYYLTMDGYVFNSASSTQTGICANTYTPHDQGNQTSITEEGEFDPTEALEILANYVEKQPTVYNQTLPTGATLRVFRASEENANGKAVIIIPGGGYAYVAGAYEGSDWAPFYLDLGFTVALLTYNMPNGNPEVPMNDGKAALQYLRDNAEDLMIDPTQIGVMGFSAGGHLASTLATHLPFEEKPAFQILFYPVITMESSFTHAGSRQNLLGDNPSEELVKYYSNEQQVTPETPCAYLCWAKDDTTVKPKNSTQYKAALSSAGVPVSSKTFNGGGHGFGFNTSYSNHTTMLFSLKKWLLALDDVITGVEGVEEFEGLRSSSGLSGLSGSSLVYNLSGQRVNEHYKGLVIKNGKKVLLR